MPWSLEKLKKKWVPGVEVLYVGKASGSGAEKHTLRKRLTELIRHSMGKTTEHGPYKGGELLWQLRGYNTSRLVFSDRSAGERGKAYWLLLVQHG